MGKYRVRGTILLNWENVVEADSEDEAEELAKGYAIDGMGLSIPVEEPEVSDVELIEE